MATSKKATGSKGGGKGLAAEVTPSADLSAVIGSKPMPRSEVTKKVWDYIKAHGLQDQTNKRMINADDNLRECRHEVRLEIAADEKSTLRVRHAVDRRVRGRERDQRGANVVVALE